VSGRMRLAVFLSAIWLAVLLGVGILAMETPTEWFLLIVFFLPLVALWGVAWVISGFKKPN